MRSTDNEFEFIKKPLQILLSDFFYLKCIMSIDPSSITESLATCDDKKYFSYLYQILNMTM